MLVPVLRAQGIENTADHAYQFPPTHSFREGDLHQDSHKAAI